MDYETTWWGKWHLNPHASASLQPYGFAGGTYPSPNGSPGQGTEVDPTIVDQFEDGSTDEAGRGRGAPRSRWSTPTTSPGGIASRAKSHGRANRRSVVSQIPPNFETPEELQAQGKPLLHRSLQETAARSFGAVPFSGPEYGRCGAG